ncbi:7-deoxyloganetic acid glucosyltransferase [Bertholletia excelsa]
MDNEVAELIPPHVLIFPFPIQGHVNSMLRLAELLCLSGLHVTFLVTDHIHSRLAHHGKVQTRFASDSRFHFETISDGLPDDHPRSGRKLIDLFSSLITTTKPLFKKLLISLRWSSGPLRPVTCVIADGILSMALGVAEEVGIPIILFRTASACSFWAFFCIPKLISSGEIPFTGNDLDSPIRSVTGMEGFLWRRDLPSFCRSTDLAEPVLQFVMSEAQQTPRARALILNTFEDLEGPILSQIRTKIPNVYAIGPLHAHMQSRLVSKSLSTATISGSLWKEDKSCIGWLDAQPSKSVIYVSFGSIVILRKDQLVEFWHGLVNSGQRILWVIRPGSIAGEDGESQIPAEVKQGMGDRGYVVGWAPQEEVLAHPSVGGFLTHRGWNSTLESIVAGKPMICWPWSSDQQVNSGFVGEVWRIGVDMKDTCDRRTIERFVRNLMEVNNDEFAQSANRMAEMARGTVSEGGTSYCNLDRLIQDIKLIGSQAERYVQAGT